MYKLIHADCMDALDKMEDNTIGSCITDPPYLINFMGKKWDTENSPAGDDQFWEKVLTKLKPGAYCVAFGHSRQHHRVMVAMEDAGFEIRDVMMWMYGSGFPKSHNVGKAVNKLEDNNSEWEGYGTALKPAYEPIIIARKPIEKKLTIAKNVLKYGVGTINIDGCRVSAPGEDFSNIKPRQIQKLHSFNHDENSVTYKEAKEKLQNIGRFPANVMLSHHPDCKKVGEAKEKIAKNVSFKDTKQSDAGWGTKKCNTENVELTRDVYECVDDCAVKMLDGQSGVTKGSGKRTITQAGIGGGVLGKHDGRKKMPTAKEGLKTVRNLGDSGGASRFFKCVDGGEDLIPGYEPIIIARKPIEKKLTVAKNVLKHGVGAINIDGCKVGYDTITTQGGDKFKSNIYGSYGTCVESQHQGRFPANVILSHHPDCKKVGEDLIPGYEPIIIARKPLEKKLTIAKNVLKHGVGAINIDECRVGYENDKADPATNPLYRHQNADKYKQVTDHGQKVGANVPFTNSLNPPTVKGRFPANVMLSHHPDCEVVGETEDTFASNDPEAGHYQTGETFVVGVGKNYKQKKSTIVREVYDCADDCPTKILDEQSGASRFFYHAKVGKKERNLGCGEMDPKDTAAKEFRPNHAVKAEAGEGGNPYGRWKPQKNNHPTVKPIALMRYLIKMYCPPKETVLDPFTGSGSTGMAAMYEGRDFIGIEREEDYLVIAEARIKYAEEDND